MVKNNCGKGNTAIIQIGCPNDGLIEKILFDWRPEESQGRNASGWKSQGNFSIASGRGKSKCKDPKVGLGRPIRETETSLGWLDFSICRRREVDKSYIYRVLRFITKSGFYFKCYFKSIHF